jgi:hypothetical protein
MGEMFLQEAGQAPARAATTARAELERLDAQLEIAAKKAALAGMQRQATAGGPSEPAAANATVTYEKDGKTIILENPTTEQLEQLGLGASPPPPELEGWQVLGLAGIVMGSIVLLTAITLWYRRMTRSAASTTGTQQSDARIARIENAIESIAVEVERISEGQRYASRMLAEGAAARTLVLERADALPQHRAEGER